MVINEFRTESFHIANWLLFNDHQVERVVWNDDRAEFVFQDFEGREEFVNGFLKDDYLQKWIDTNSKLKNFMYANKPPKKYDRHN